MPQQRQRLGAGVVWLTALIVVPVIVAELQATRMPEAAAAQAKPAPAAPVVAAPAPQMPRTLGDGPLAVIALPVPPPGRPSTPAANLAQLAKPVALVVPDLKREQRRDAAPRSNLAYRRGVVRSDLYAAGFVAGVPLTVLASMIRGFSYDIDFQRDMRSGDSFEVAFEGQTLRHAALTLGGKRHSIYRLPVHDGDDDWFDEHGVSVRKTLLRTPVDGGRLTSGFGRRSHPLYGYTMAHRGVDFGAASGSPVQAAGDGTVEMVDRLGGYGNYVRIRHDGQIETAYAHLSRFGAGVYEGARVRQGQVIGYVGATGRVTAPHLHFEVLRQGVQVNPMSVNFSTGTRLAGAELAAFKAARASLDAAVASLARPGAQIARAQ